MSIVFGTAGAANNGSTGFTCGLPASIANGDLLLLAVASKYPATPPNTPSGWILVGQAIGGLGASGQDAGQVLTTVFGRIANGTETGNVTDTMGSNCCRARIFRYTKAAAKNWELVATTGADATADGTWSVTFGSDPGIIASDMIFVASGVNGDIASTLVSAEAVSATGATFGAVTEREDGGSNTGDDIALFVTQHPVTAGPASAAPTYTATLGGTPTANSPTGASVLVRMREVDLLADPSSIVSGEAFGSASVGHELSAVSISSGEAFDVPIIAPTQTTLVTSIDSSEAFGSPVLSIELGADAVASGELFDDPIIVTIDVIATTSVDSAEAFGDPSIRSDIYLDGVTSSETFGDATIGLVPPPISVLQEVVATPVGDARAKIHVPLSAYAQVVIDLVGRHGEPIHLNPAIDTASLLIRRRRGASPIFTVVGELNDRQVRFVFTPEMLRSVEWGHYLYTVVVRRPGEEDLTIAESPILLEPSITDLTV